MVILREKALPIHGGSDFAAMAAKPVFFSIGAPRRFSLAAADKLPGLPFWGTKNAGGRNASSRSFSGGFAPTPPRPPLLAVSRTAGARKRCFQRTPRKPSS